MASVQGLGNQKSCTCGSSIGSPANFKNAVRNNLDAALRGHLIAWGWGGVGWGGVGWGG